MYLKADTKIFFFLNSIGEALEELLAERRSAFLPAEAQGLLWLECFDPNPAGQIYELL